MREIPELLTPAAFIRVAESLGTTAGDAVEFFGGPATIYRYPPRETAAQ